MLVKDLLNKYNGQFYIYEDVLNEYGSIIDVNCIASHEDLITENKHTNEIKERKVHNFEAGMFFLNIYLEYKRKTTDNIMNENITFLELSTRIIHTLYRARINTVGELCTKTYIDILKIRGLGRDSLKEIIEAIQIYNLHLKENED